MINNIRSHKLYPIFLLAIAVPLLAYSIAQAASNIDSTNKYAWGSNVGWINFNDANGGVTVYDDHLEGYAWGENIGWIRMGSHTGGSPFTYANNLTGNYGVNHDGAGNLSGYAWSPTVGWINFNPKDGGVTIDLTTGDFDGYAWGENIGWIKLNGTATNRSDYMVSTGYYPKPEIDVQRPAGASIADGGTDAQGVKQSGQQVTVTYTVKKTGSSALNVNNITYTSASGVTVNSISPTSLSNIAGGGSQTFEVKYTLAAGDGAFSFELDLTNNDVLPEDNYDITVSGTRDGTAPTVTIEQAASQADPTLSSPVNFTVTFSELVTGFVTGDVTLSGTAGATTGMVTEIAPNNGTTYNVAVSGMTKGGTVIATVEADKAADAVGHDNAASTSTDDSVVFNVHPTIEKTFAPDSIGAGDVSTLTFTLTNPNTHTALNGLNFTDDMTALGVQIANTPNVGGTCNNDIVLVTHFTPTLAAGGTQINLVSGSGYSLAAEASCAITVDVTAITTGNKDNTSGNVGSTDFGAGNDNATDTLSVGDPTLSITMVGNFGADNVTSTPAGIDCPGDCSESYTYNTNVTLGVTVDTGSSFQGWSGDCAPFGAALHGAITLDGSKECTATFASQPEIDLQRPAGTSILDGGADNIADQSPGTVHVSYTLDNTIGGAELTISDVTADNLVNVSNFNVVTPLPYEVASGAAGTLDIAFDVINLGPFSLEMQIENDDPDENPYDIRIAGTGASVPEIAVIGNDVSIFDGDTTPDRADHTDFGNADETGARITRTFMIKNTGQANLKLTGGPPRVAIGGPQTGDFALTTDATTPVTTDGTTSFTITFDPSAQGLREATVSIETNDGDENPFDFSIQGTGTGPAPEMDVLGNGNSIPSGDSSPRALDQTNFGEVPVVGGKVNYVYTIENTGSVELNLTDSPKVTIAGAHAAEFAVIWDATTPVANLVGTTTFEISFDPRGEGVRQASVSIANDDNDEDPYTFDIQGWGVTSGEEEGSNRKFNIGEDGGRFKAFPVTVIVPAGAVPNETTLVIQPVPREDEEANIILGDQVYDIHFIGPDGVEITTFFLPIQIMFKPSTAQLRQAGYNLDNLHVLTRHGDEGWRGVANAYSVDDHRCVDMWQFSYFGLGVAPLPGTGFATGVEHSLAGQPEEKGYSEYFEFRLQIPALGVDIPIVGVPLTIEGWDVTWLGERAGWESGLATWKARPSRPGRATRPSQRMSGMRTTRRVPLLICTRSNMATGLSSRPGGRRMSTKCAPRVRLVRRI